MRRVAIVGFASDVGPELDGRNAAEQLAPVVDQALEGRAALAASSPPSAPPAGGGHPVRRPPPRLVFGCAAVLLGYPGDDFAADLDAVAAALSRLPAGTTRDRLEHVRAWLAASPPAPGSWKRSISSGGARCT